MTAISLPADVRARPWARVIAAVALIAAILSGLFGASPAHAAADTDEPTGIAELNIAAGSYGVVSSGMPVLTTLTTVNGTDEELPAGTIQLELNRTPLSDANALQAWSNRGTASGTFEPLGTTESTAVPADEKAERSLLVTSEKIGELAPGVYPLRAALRPTDETPDIGPPGAPVLHGTSVLIVRDDANPAVTVLVPITATPQNGALLSAEELTALTAPEGTLTAQLDGVSGTSAVLAIDPLIPAAIRALGTAAPTTAVEWLERLDRMPQERFALQPADADAATQAHAGLSFLLGPTSLSPYLAAENFMPTPDASPTPAPAGVPEPTPTPDAPLEPDFPTTEELLALDGATSTAVWPLDDLGTSDLDLFAAVLGEDTATIVPSATVTDASSAHGMLGGHSALIVNDELSTLFGNALAEEDDLNREEDLTASLAELSLRDDLGGSILIGLDRNETRAADALRDVVEAASALGTGTGLSALRESTPASLAFTTNRPTERGDALNTLLNDEEVLRQFGSILDDPEVLLAPERLRILRVLSNRKITDFNEAVTAHRARTEETLGAVSIQDPGSPQLLTAQAPLPIRVTNSLPWPVNVRLHARLDSVILHIQPTTEATAQPDSNTRISVPVEARVASGEVNVTLSLTSPTGVPIGGEEVAKVTVRAEWENIGLIILGSLIGLLLIVGIVRTVLRRRAAAKASPNEAGSTDGTGPTHETASVDGAGAAHGTESADEAGPIDETGSADATS